MKLAIAHRDRLVREALRRTLMKGHYELVWQASDRAQMEHNCRYQSTDLLLAELHLLGPKAQALPRLLESGAAVIALAPSNAVGDAYEALGQGALGLLQPPALDDNGELIGAQRSLTRIDRLAKLVGDSDFSATASTQATPGQTLIVALGASTGGPLALAKILSSMPVDLDAAVLIVQHIDNEYTAGLAEWLGSQCALPVSVAAHGDTPTARRVYVAGSSGHLVLLPSFQFGNQPARATELHAPSVDALFLSLALHATPAAAAILTGMGSDGVAGLGAMHRAGWFTLAQDEHSSVVYGMPRAAVEAGAAQQILDVTEIGPALVRQVSRIRRR